VSGAIGIGDQGDKIVVDKRQSVIILRSIVGGYLEGVK